MIIRINQKIKKNNQKFRYLIIKIIILMNKLLKIIKKTNKFNNLLIYFKTNFQSNKKKRYNRKI